MLNEKELLEDESLKDFQEAINCNLNKEVSIKKFNKELSLRKDGFSLKKIANVISSKNKCGYGYDKVAKDYWSKDKVGFVYAIVANKKIVKIGMSETTLNSRFSSYMAGTRKNRGKGTCSLTNYYCSEFIRKCLANKLELEIYAFNTPVNNVEYSILGETVVTKPKIGYIYELMLLKFYKEMTGDTPILCSNTSLI
jgi:hypothetical protein